jgi:hypothetical protein
MRIYCVGTYYFDIRDSCNRRVVVLFPKRVSSKLYYCLPHSHQTKPSTTFLLVFRPNHRVTRTLYLLALLDVYMCVYIIYIHISCVGTEILTAYVFFPLQNTCLYFIMVSHYYLILYYILRI